MNDQGRMIFDTRNVISTYKDDLAFCCDLYKSVLVQALAESDISSMVVK